MRRNGFTIPPSSSANLFLGYDSPRDDQTEHEPQGAVFRTNAGLILPLFHEALPEEKLDLDDLRIHLERVKNLYCILGMRRDVDCCATAQPSTINVRRYYYLMRRLKETVLPEPPNIPDLKIRRLTPHHAAKTFPLEEAYQKEEVLVHPGQFNSTAHYLHFTRLIRRNRIYFAELDGRPVAKAGTNALGWNYCQIGGVYTAPEYRGRGISRALMITLLRWIYDRDQSAVLFVDTANTAACTLYKHLDFCYEGEYEIAYTELD